MASILSRDGTDIKGAGNVTELSAETKKIVDLADPTAPQDAATKAYVDASAGTASDALDGTFTINNTADPTKKIAFDAANIATATNRKITMPDADVNLGLVNSAIQSSEKGAANGVTPLNALAKIDSTYLPSYVDDVLEYANLAAFPVTGEVGIIYIALDSNKTYRWSGSTYVEISAGPANTDALAEGSTNLYYTQARFDSAFAAKDTDDLSEGVTNLYFTDARAKAAAVADSITDGVTDVAPSQNAVFDALALKSNVGHTHVAADVTDFSAAAKAAAVADAIVDGVTDVAPSQNAVFDALVLKASAADAGKVFDSGVAGEIFGANQIWLVRRAKSGETAGRYYKATADSFANSRVVGFIVVGASAVSAADPIVVYKLGQGALGSLDTGFGVGNINAPVYLHQSTPGKFTLTPVTTTGSIIKPVGYVADDLMIEFQPELAIQA